MGVAREMGRLIRLSYNGHLPPEELTKYIFALDNFAPVLRAQLPSMPPLPRRSKTSPRP